MTKKVRASGVIAMLSAVYLTSIASAQTRWERTYGGQYSEEARSAQQTADGGYILAGSTYSFGPGTPDSQNVYLVKTDSLGDTLWTRVYGGIGVDVATSVRTTSDGGCVVAGYTSSGGAGGKDVYLIKTDSSGDTLWTRTYGGQYGDYGYSVQPTADGGYAIAGFTFSFGVMGDFYFIKTDSSGDTLWTRIYGGTSTDWSNSSQQTLDGGYVIAGSTYSFGPGIPDSDNVYLVRTNAQGDTLWTRSYGGQSWDEGYSVQQTSDSGFIVTGVTQSFGAGLGDVYLIKTDARGDTLWIRTYGDTLNEHGNCVRQTNDGGYIVTGYTSSFGALGGDVYVIRANASGDTLWTRTYGGTSDADWGDCVEQTVDGGYAIAGGTYSFGAGAEDFYLIKTDSNGYANGMEEPLARRPANPARFLVRPNPFTSRAKVPGHEGQLFVLSDITGRQVAISRGDRVGEGLRPGVYFLSPVGSKVGKTARTTIIKAAY